MLALLSWSDALFALMAAMAMAGAARVVWICWPLVFGDDREKVMESKKGPEPAMPEEMEERYVLPLERAALKTQTTTRSFEESWMTTATWVSHPSGAAQTPEKEPGAKTQAEEKKEENR